MKWRLALIFLLVVGVAWSGLSVVASKHESRKLFQQLVKHERAYDALQIEWGQLQLEQYTYATHGKIKSKATDALQMKVPGGGDTVMVVHSQ